jgi:hypothetical protein
VTGSVLDPWFATTVAEWLKESSELLVMLRYPNAGGSRDYELHRSLQSIKDRLLVVPAQTSVIVFLKPQLPIRGVVDEALITTSLNSIPDGTEYLLVETVLTAAGKGRWYHQDSGTTHVELKATLASSLGKAVMLGVYPPWLHDGPSVVSGYVPDAKGHIQPGRTELSRIHQFQSAVLSSLRCGTPAAELGH